MKKVTVLGGAIVLLWIWGICWVEGDHYEGGAIRWYTSTKVPNTVFLVIRQLWNTESDTHSRDSRIFWGDARVTHIVEAEPENCAAYQGEKRVGIGACLEGKVTLSNGLVFDVTEAWVKHTYKAPGVYAGQKLQTDTRSTTPENVGGGTGLNSFSIKVDGTRYIQSPYFSGFLPGYVEDMRLRIPRTPSGIRAFPWPGFNSVLGITKLNETICRTYTATEADIRRAQRGPPIDPNIIQTHNGESLELTSDCVVLWDTSHVPRNSHWALPVLLTSKTDPDVQSWFEVPIDVDDKSVFCYSENNLVYPLVVPEVQETYDISDTFYANDGLTYYPHPRRPAFHLPPLYYEPYELDPNVTLTPPPNPPPAEPYHNPFNVTFFWRAPPLQLGLHNFFIRLSTTAGGPEFSYICGYPVKVIERSCSVTFLNDASGGVDGLFQIQCSQEEQDLFGIPVRR